MWRCALGHHDQIVGISQGRWRVLCARCGRMSEGIAPGPLAIQQTQAIKGQRLSLIRQMQRAWLSVRLHEADAGREA